jgi:tetratricopeptide (TPR) repeat protein
MSPISSAEIDGGRSRIQSPPTNFREWSLPPAAGIFLLLLPILALGAFLSWQTFRVGRAISRMDDISIPQSEKALQQDPGNADLLHHVGTLYSTDPTEANPAEAVRNLREAVARNPRRWDYWMDLGIACDFASDIACSDHAFEQSAAINPKTPAVMWAVGNHYLLTDRPDQAYPAFRHLIALDPQYLILVFRMLFRATRDPQAIYDGIAAKSPDPSIRFSLLRFLCSMADFESAMKLWSEMISGPDPHPQLSLVTPFLDLLTDHNEIDDASKVWSDLQRAGLVQPTPPEGAPNLLYNGDFGRPPLNSGFDWRVSGSPDLEIDLADPTGYQGSKCVRVEFPVGRDADYDLLSQLVRVEPNTRYELSAYLRSDSLTSESGPRLRADEIGCSDCPLRTSDPTVGSTPWHEVDVEFTTEPQTQAVKVSFWRPKEPTFSRDITGTVWLSDINLRAVNGSTSFPHLEKTP